MTNDDELLEQLSHHHPIGLDAAARIRELLYALNTIAMTTKPILSEGPVIRHIDITARRAIRASQKGDE